MAASKIPEEIKKHRPGPCTEVKLINGHYYVYMYQSVQLPSGKWGKKTGMIILEGFEPPVRILRATIPGIGSQSKFGILLLIDYLPRHYL